MGYAGLIFLTRIIWACELVLTAIRSAPKHIIAGVHKMGKQAKGMGWLRWWKINSFAPEIP